MNQRALIVTTFAVLAAFGSAQSRSSFQVPSSLTGVTVTAHSPLNYSVALAGDASMFYKGKNYKVQDVFGFWLLDNNNDMNASGQSFGAWQYHSNYKGTGGIAGYKTNPNTGIQGGGSQDFKFKSISGSPESFGIHIRLKDCDTLYVEVPCTPVPEPATMAVLGLGAAALIRRRKRN